MLISGRNMLWPKRHFRICAAALLLAMGTAQFVAGLRDSQTYDESYHLVNGYEFLKTGAIRPVPEHPPFWQAISALPLLLLNLRPPEKSRPGYDEYDRERDFLYRNTSPADTILMLARIPTILASLLTGLVMAWWLRRRFGELAALAALTLYCFDPNFLAHGHYVTADVPAALWFLSAILAWGRFLENGSTRSAALCGLAVGAAMATKYSATLLLYILVCLYLFRLWQQLGVKRGAVAWSTIHLARSLAVVGVVTFAAMFIGFGFETGKVMPPRSLAAFQAENIPVSGDTFPHLTLPAPSFFRGLYAVTVHNSQGHPAYLLGEHGLRGWWYYFPVVMAVKTPTGTLLLLLLALIAAVLARPALKRLPPHWYILLLPPVLYFAVSMQSHINIGVRHILPVYPLLYMWAAAVLFSGQVALPSYFRKAAAICLALVVLESAAVFPRYLGFFNLPSGGPRQGSKYLVDSNLDWGQDLKRLKTYLTGRGITNVCLKAFGPAPPSYYGIEFKPMPESRDELRASGCVVVMSLTSLYERQPFDGRYDWMLRTPPIDTVGDSFRVYAPQR